MLNFLLKILILMVCNNVIMLVFNVEQGFQSLLVLLLIDMFVLLPIINLIIGDYSVPTKKD